MEQKKSTLEYVLDYAQKGWAVFPLQGKCPLKGSHGHLDATTDPETIKKWFSNTNYNIGIATGKISGVIVLDIDVKNEARGEESIAELEKEYGKLPETVQAISWSGGRHLLFKYPKGGIGCKIGFRPDIDIKGDGGYVIVEPSFVKKGVLQGEYAWEVMHHPDNMEMAEAPEWLLNLIREDKKKKKNENNNKEIIPIGERNDSLTSIAGSLRRSGADFEYIYKFLSDLNKNRCNPALTSKEVENIAQSISKYPIPDQLLSEPLTDSWNAKIFQLVNGESVKYCNKLGGWFIWTGTHYELDEKHQIIKLAQQACKHFLKFNQVSPEKEKELRKHYKKTLSEAKLRSMINLSKAEPGISERFDQFDRNDFLLNCKNGTLDLLTGDFYVNKKSDLITKCIQHSYYPEAKCPEWEKFLSSIFMNNQELINFMQKALGYSLSGSVIEQCIFLLYGTGANGKSTFLKHLFSVLGDYAISTPPETLLERYGDTIPNDVARLRGHRFVTSIESSHTRYLAEGKIKQLTGDDVITARFLHKEYFDFRSTFKIFFATNNKPTISGMDKGIWRRIRLIPFEKYYSPEERDPKLDEKLSSEYEGILAWTVEGFKKWQKEGLIQVDKIIQATNEFREECDVIGTFLTEEYIENPNYQVLSSSLRDALNEWCKKAGTKKVKKGELFSYLKDKGFKHMKASNGKNKGKNIWCGLGSIYQQKDNSGEIEPNDNFDEYIDESNFKREW